MEKRPSPAPAGQPGATASRGATARRPVLPPLRFTVLPGALALCRLDAAAPIPDWAVVGDPLVSITRTPDELSLVVPASSVPAGLSAEGPFRALSLEGPLPLTAIGVLARVSVALAGARIPTLCLGSFDTDTFLVPLARVPRAVRTLEAAGLEHVTHRRPLRYGLFTTPFGRLLAATSAQGLVWAAFGEDDSTLLEALLRAFPEAPATRDDAALAPLRSALLATLEGTPYCAPLMPSGTPFQQRVWAALRDVPAGQTLTYAALAAQAGLGASGARVVAQAVAANPIALAIPCHRVVRTDARPTDFRWGAPRKVALLNYERLGQLSLFEDA